MATIATSKRPSEAGTPPKVHKAEIERHDGPILLPQTLALSDAIVVLKRQLDYESAVTMAAYDLPCFPWDGAIAFHAVMVERFGAAFVSGTPSMFDSGSAKEIAVVIDADGNTKRVPWGRIAIPGLPTTVAGDSCNFLQMDAGRGPKGSFSFKLVGKVQRLALPTVDAIVKDVREYVAKHSIYRGKAIKATFTDSDGDLMPMPQLDFIYTRGLDASQVVFSADIERAIEDNIYTRIRHRDAARKAGVPDKGGAILAGKPGVGKSELARLLAGVSTESQHTYLLCEKASDLPYALRFAEQYQPAVIMAEDIDRVASGERTERIDALLNTVDGVDTKAMAVYVIVTTNDLAAIREEFKRPGRFDVVLTLEEPDVEAVDRMIRAHTKGMLAPNTTLSGAASMLAGLTPANVIECVNRAKLGYIRRNGGANGAAIQLTTEDFETAAYTVKRQVDAIEAGQRKPVTHPALAAHQELIEAISNI